MKFMIALSVLLAGYFAEASDFSCKDAQQYILNFPEESLEKLNIEEEKTLDLQFFLESKPSLDQLTLSTYSFIFKDTPYEQLWCKLKSQPAVARQLKTPPSAPVKDCSALNERILSLALKELDSDSTKSPTLSELGILILDDKDAFGGGDWSSAKVNFQITANIIGIQAIRLKSPLWLGAVGGMNYCKILSLAGAKSLIQERISQLSGTN
jgi:hypothetical protein